MKLVKDNEPPEVLCEVRKSRDVVLVVRLMHVDGLKYIDMRDWLESKQAWGRGYWFDATERNLTEIASSLLSVAEDLNE